MAQLRESLNKSREMMLNEKLDVKTREAWTQKHTNTAQVLNQVLQDRQLKNWERRLRELEARRLIPRATTPRLETLRARNNHETNRGPRDAKQDKPSEAGGSD